MKDVELVELAAQFSNLLDDVAQGDEITIWRDGKPVARLLPVHDKRKPEESHG